MRVLAGVWGIVSQEVAGEGWADGKGAAQLRYSRGTTKKQPRNSQGTATQVGNLQIHMSVPAVTRARLGTGEGQCVSTKSMGIEMKTAIRPRSGGH